eukprot:COSAG01_NODE_33598_length_561_cov_2.452381_2_plen_30_part_01
MPSQVDAIRGLLARGLAAGRVEMCGERLVH